MTSLATEPHQTRLDSLTGLRFYAALAVLLRHTVPEFIPLTVLRELAAIGPIGVGFFFVLSGFILTWIWQPGSARNFYVRRAARIGPLHVVTTVLAVAYLWTQSDPLWLSSILSLFLLQGWMSEPLRTGGNGPSWSLSCEAFFYAAFPFIVRRLTRLTPRRAGLTIGLTFTAMCAWTVGYAVLIKVGMPGVTALSTYTNPAYRLGEFVIGICLASAMGAGWSIRMSMRVALGLAASAYVALAGTNYAVGRLGISLGDGAGLPLGVLDLVFLPVSAMLVAVAAGADATGAPSPVRGRWHVMLGEWSFALYLTQMLVVIPAVRLVSQDAPLWLGGLAWVAVTGGCIAVSACVFTYFEKPSERWLRRRLLTPEPDAVRR